MSDDRGEFLAIGDRFHGYVVEKSLGHGGIGAVYLVRHEVLDTHYALKILDPAVVERDPSYLKRFLREARLATRVRHPNLVAVHDCGHDSDTNLYYLVMDYVSGGTLRDILAFEGRFEVARAAEVILQVASALRAAQEFQVVHRDIKPENIMIQADGRVKLVDMGIAKAQGLGDSIRTNTDSIFGTPSYISPEQAQCSASVDTRADIYSLGIVFFEMLAGKCPYTGGNVAQVLSQILSEEPTPDIRDVRADVPAEVAVIIRRMTQKDVDRRLGSLNEVIRLLSELEGVGQMKIELSGEIVSQPQVGMETLLNRIDPTLSAASSDMAVSSDIMAPGSRWNSRKSLWVALGIIGSLVLCGILYLVCLK